MPQHFLIDAPPLEPVITGLLNVVDPQPFTDAHQALGIRYATQARGAARFTSAGCFTAPQITGDMPKVSEGEGIEEIGDPFAIYYGVECSMFRYEQYAAEAEEGLVNGATVAIETGVQKIILNPRAVNLTPGTGAVKPKAAIGLLEQWIGKRYAGRPIIHVSKFGAAFLPLEVGENGAPMTTKSGVPVANGAGYDDTDGPGVLTAGPGQFWMYVTGQVHIWWGPIVSNFAQDLEHNTAGALAERIIVATVDQWVGAILVTTEGA